MSIRNLLLATLCSFAAGAVLARSVPASVQDAAAQIEKQFSLKIKDLRALPSGMFEGVVNGEPVYFDASGKTFIVGQVIDVQSGRNLTQERKDELLRFDPAKEIKSSWTFSEVRGKPQATVYVFTDPKCPYCQRLEPELEKLQNVRIVYVPLAYQRSDDQVAAVLCAKDRLKAWKEAVGGGIRDPQSTPECQKITEEIRNFALSKGINGTPVIVYASGKRIQGLASASEIEKQLR